MREIRARCRLCADNVVSSAVIVCDDPIVRLSVCPLASPVATTDKTAPANSAGYGFEKSGVSLRPKTYLKYNNTVGYIANPFLLFVHAFSVTW